MLLTCVINYSVIHCADRCYSSNLSLWLHDMTIYSLFVVQCCSAALNCLSFFISCKQACYARHTSKFYIAFYGLPLHYVLPIFFACLHADGNIVVPVRFRPFNAANVSKRMVLSSNVLDGLVGASFQFFESYRRYKNSKGTPSAGALNVWRSKIFQQILLVVLKTVPDVPIWNINSKCQVADRSVSVPQTE